MEALRNLGRHKLRNGLTIGGIVIGVLALVTMGAMAEKTNSLFDGGERFFADHVSVADSRSSAFGGGLMELVKVAEIERIDGVAAAFPTVGVQAKATSSGVNFGPPPFVSGTLDGYEKYSSFKLTIAHGRERAPGSRGEVVVGADLAKQYGLSPGSTIRFPIIDEPQPGLTQYPFTVVGILEKTLTLPDTGAFVSLADAQQLLKERLPPAIKGQVDTTTLATGIDVFGKPGVDLDDLARRIARDVPAVRATPPSELVAQFRAASVIFSAITTGSALLALIIGGLSVINTMSMAVVERFREIGLKKAVGARTGHILGEFLWESVAIGLIGGVIGLAAGWLITQGINAATADQNLELFLVTPRLVAIAIGFSVGLGALAGLIPALRAARLDPVIALRYQ
jgi:putative ABC transport system permease protein